MENPTYYAIIPSEVRYSELKPSAKLLYGEITALTNKKGYCFATNKYFAELYNVGKNTISLWIKQLQQFKFIEVEMVYKNKQIIERKIYITNLKGGVIINNDSTTIKNSEDNNTSINTTSYNIQERKRKFEIEVFSIEKNNTSRDFIDYWTETNKLGSKMKFEMEKTWNTSLRLKRWNRYNNIWDKSKPQKVSKIKTTLTTNQAAKHLMNKINASN